MIRFFNRFFERLGGFIPSDDPIIETGTFTGTASYATGGFTINTGLTQVDFLDLWIDTAGANLLPCHFLIARSGANATVKVMVHKYDKSPTNVGALSGLPSGVSAASASGQTYDADAAHVHSMAHDHGSVTSGGVANASGGITLGVAGSAISTHTHPVNPPNYTGNTGAGSSHTHTWDSIYQHGHSVTQTETDMTFVELANGTDLSGATLGYIAVQE